MNKERDNAGIEKWMFIHSYAFINLYFYQHNKKTSETYIKICFIYRLL